MAVVSHVVLLSWKPGRAAAAEESVRPAIRAFSGTIPGVTAVVEGPSVSPEGLEDGFDYGFVVTFAGPDDRDGYLPDPRHQVVAKVIEAEAARLAVFDI